jgi:hypothetical protein
LMLLPARLAMKTSATAKARATLLHAPAFSNWCVILVPLRSLVAFIR